MASNSIPLHCNICPRKPNFSDVSHLLTHIASKGHLSNYYKMKVRSGSEESSRRLIEAYDRWYTEWDVEDLMSERMNQKDKRRTRTRPSGRASQAPRIEAPVPRSARPRAAVGNLLDPRLHISEQQHIKVETATPTPPPHAMSMGPILRQRGFASRVQYWPADSRSTSRSYDYDTSSDYSDHIDRKRYRYSPDDSCAVEDDPADTATLTTEDATTTTVSECTKLKGVYWPGMDIFDSATPEMRRKRNQKKDHSVVEQLEVNSLEVEPTELIFTPQGSFKRQRRISSSISDDEEESPLMRESPPRSYRPALAKLDANASRRNRQQGRSTLSMLGRSGYAENRGRSGYTIGDHGQRNGRKRGFDVFQGDEVALNTPTPFNLLTAGFHPHQSTSTPTPALQQYKPSYDSFQFDNKENIMPPFHYQQSHARLPPAVYHYQPFPYGLGYEQHALQHYNSMHLNNAYQQHQLDDADDQRTLTAPPSPSTS